MSPCGFADKPRLQIMPVYVAGFSQVSSLDDPDGFLYSRTVAVGKIHQMPDIVTLSGLDRTASHTPCVAQIGGQRLFAQYMFSSFESW